ncbi:paraneoplastic antigen Ma1 homolog [Ictalurus punctatus]|uniref:Paraneoplastic antigen Ma1 homolog n=1 Tax=Ictalurus punctatus TaxID=7998 RepID=A0A2D0SI82_ICTPU|nr:paraneoplastic antigen Ma1 homolog [Ictalurus punctatus]
MELQSVKLELVKELREWCQGESLDQIHTLLAVVPKEFEVAQIGETLETIKALGRVRVRGREFNTTLDRLTVLCECKEKIDPTKVPYEVMHTHTDEAWPIVMATEAPALDEDAQTPLKVLLEASTSSGSAESIIRAVGDLLSKIEKPSGENSNYRHLRMLSGTLPAPAEEEVLEHWIEQARLMVEESDCSAKEKRQRIMESLRRPALAVVKTVCTADADVTPHKCLDAIESAFRTAESGEYLYFDFRLLYQGQYEKLSDLLRRLEQSLTKVVIKGGVPASHVDIARVEQLLWGAIHSDLIIVQLKLRERKQNPPTFLELLAEIRAERSSPPLESRLICLHI